MVTERAYAQLRAGEQLAAQGHSDAHAHLDLLAVCTRAPHAVVCGESALSLRELIDDLIVWSQQLHFSMIAVDHQAEVLRRLCPQRAVVIEHGKIVQAGTWDELNQAPATPLLRSLLAPL